MRDRDKDTVDCGAGADTVVADAKDTLVNCEEAKVRGKQDKPAKAKGPQGTGPQGTGPQGTGPQA